MGRGLGMARIVGVLVIAEILGTVHVDQGGRNGTRNVPGVLKTRRRGGRPHLAIHRRFVSEALAGRDAP